MQETLSKLPPQLKKFKEGRSFSVSKLLNKMGTTEERVGQITATTNKVVESYNNLPQKTKLMVGAGLATLSMTGTAGGAPLIASAISACYLPTKTASSFDEIDILTETLRQKYEAINQDLTPAKKKALRLGILTTTAIFNVAGEEAIGRALSDSQILEKIKNFKVSDLNAMFPSVTATPPENTVPTVEELSIALPAEHELKGEVSVEEKLQDGVEIVLDTSNQHVSGTTKETTQEKSDYDANALTTESTPEPVAPVNPQTNTEVKTVEIPSPEIDTPSPVVSETEVTEELQDIQKDGFDTANNLGIEESYTQNQAQPDTANTVETALENQNDSMSVATDSGAPTNVTSTPTSLPIEEATDTTITETSEQQKIADIHEGDIAPPQEGQVVESATTQPEVPTTQPTPSTQPVTLSFTQNPSLSQDDMRQLEILKGIESNQAFSNALSDASRKIERAKSFFSFGSGDEVKKHFLDFVHNNPSVSLKTLLEVDLATLSPSDQNILKEVRGVVTLLMPGQVLNDQNIRNMSLVSLLQTKAS